MHPYSCPIKSKVCVDEQTGTAGKAHIVTCVYFPSYLGCPLFLSATLFFISATALVNSGKWNSVQKENFMSAFVDEGLVAQLSE